MKRFRFNLEKVLQLRVNLLDQVRAEFKAVLAEAGRLERIWVALKEERREAQILLLKERERPSMEASRILLLQDGLEQIENEITLARGRLDAALKIVEQQRIKLRTAKQGVDMLERIKAKHYKRYQAAALAEEMKQLNEIAVTRFVRNGSGGEGSMVGDRENA